MKSLVQIGCNIGDERVFKTIYEQKISKCIFVDANESVLKICYDNFENYLSDKDIDFDIDLHFVCSSISNKVDKYLDLYIPNGVSLSGHSSIYAYQLNNQKYNTIRVLNTTIGDLLNSFKLRVVDYLIVDAEGCDKEILSTLDLSYYIIKNIKFEFTHWDGYGGYISHNLNEYIFFLLMRGYSVKKISATDIEASL